MACNDNFTLSGHLERISDSKTQRLSTTVHIRTFNNMHNNTCGQESHFSSNFAIHSHIHHVPEDMNMHGVDLIACNTLTTQVTAQHNNFISTEREQGFST